MAQSYASRLKKGIPYGTCGLPENFDTERVLIDKVEKLSKMIQESNYMVVHTGAGRALVLVDKQACLLPLESLTFEVLQEIIRNGEGPNGVWTKEKQGCLDPDDPYDFRFEDARPSFTHLALLTLMEAGKLKYICSQNVDGLHLRSGVPRSKLSELHGNVFVEECEDCEKQYFLPFDVQSIGFQYTGKLRDTLLDWDDALPESDFKLAKKHSKQADLILCLGTSLRVEPANKIPLLTKKNNGKLVICNLQATPLDPKATMKIHARCDLVMREVMKRLKLPVAVYSHKESLVFTLGREKQKWNFECLLESRTRKRVIDKITLERKGQTVEIAKGPWEHSWEDQTVEGSTVTVTVQLREGCDPPSIQKEFVFKKGEKVEERVHVITEVVNPNLFGLESVKEVLSQEKAHQSNSKRQKTK